MLMPPNPDNKAEIWMAVTLIGGFFRSGNEWVFLFALLVLICYIVGLFLYRATTYAVAVYAQRVRVTGEHRNIFIAALIAALIVGVLVVVFWQNESTRPLALLVGCCGFAVFAVFTTSFDWYVDTQAADAAPMLEDVKVNELIMYQNMVNAAHDAQQKAEA
jgi:hypothetical protein